MFNDFKNLSTKWAAEWQDRNFRNLFVLTILFVAGANLFSFYCFVEMGGRPGRQLNDYCHMLLKPHDFSLILFTLIYSSVLLAFVYLIPHPKKLMMGLQAFAIICLMRVVSIYMVPLSPPAQMIILHDPIAEFFLKRGDVMVTNDLFFSGHVAFCILLFFTAQNRVIKIITGITTFIIAVLIVWQHVHYTVDVLAAPIFAYAAVRMVAYMYYNYERSIATAASNNHD